MKHLTRSTLTGLMLVLGITARADAPPGVPDPTTPVAVLQAALSSPAGAPGKARRAQQLTPAIAAAFDFATLGRLVLRRDWGQLGDQQQADFVAALEALTVSTYADRFDAQPPQFGPLTVTDLPRGRAQVRSDLRRTAAPPVTFDYIVHNTDTGWRIINVVAAGVSDAALRSSQYSRVIEQEGFEALLDRMRQEIADNLAP